MLETLIECPICRQPEFREELKAVDHTVSRETFSIVSCTHCGLWFTNPRPDQDVIGAYYLSEDYISHSNKARDLVGKLYKIVRGITLRKKARLVRGLNAGRPGRILDIGCGTGEFLHACIKSGWACQGIEPFISARRFATEEYGLRVEDEPGLDRFEHGSFDIITLWHVLEHVPRLRERLRQIKALIKKGGKIVIAVPNRMSQDAKAYGSLWAAWDVPRHLYHFSPDDIHRLMGDEGLKVQAMHPMYFDAYYVSMLSEKYRKGSFSLIRSTWNGMQSNMAARRHPGTCSSQIYIISAQDGAY